MWFKQLSWFKVDSGLPETTEQFEELLQQSPLHACSAGQASSVGWISPYPGDSPVLLHVCEFFQMVSLGFEEKVLPGQVVSQHLDERIRALEAQHGKKIRGRAKASLKDDIRFELLTQAFSRKKRINAFFDTRNAWLLVDTASKTALEQFLEKIRETLPDLKLLPIETDSNLGLQLTNWLLNQEAEEGFSLADECALVDRDRDEGKVRLARQDLTAHDVLELIKAHRKVTMMGLTWQDRVQFALHDDLHLSKIKFLDIIREALDDQEMEDEMQAFDANFAVMAHELTSLLTELAQAIKVK